MGTRAGGVPAPPFPPAPIWTQSSNNWLSGGHTAETSGCETSSNEGRSAKADTLAADSRKIDATRKQVR